MEKDKKKKITIILLILLMLLTIGGAVYLLFLRNDKNSENTPTENTAESVNNEVTPLREFVLNDSSEAISKTYAKAQEWASDVKLYKCSGLATSLIYDDVTYKYVGYESGMYYKWFCEYYSQSKAQTSIYVYDEGEVPDDTEPIDIGEYSSSMYNSIDYPTPTSVISSTSVYETVIKNGANETDNFLNMYLQDTTDYGYVWVINERSRTEADEYEIGLLVNTYVIDRNSGDLITKVQEEVY